MSALPLVAVLFSAILHGSWNALAKVVPDRLAASALLGLTYAAIGGVATFFVGVPHPETWPLLLASASVQTAYVVLLTAAYARTEFSTAYPLTRGLAVIGVTLVSTVFLGERLTPVQAMGVAAVAVGLLALALGGARRLDSRGLVLVFLVGACVTAYTVLDGAGVRASGDVLAYAAWLFLLQGLTLPLVALALAPNRRTLLRAVRTSVGPGVAGGVLSLVAYTIVVWAQSVAPLSLVAALRESGVLVAGVLGVLVFRERLTAPRVGGTLVAVAGLVLVRLGG